MALSKYFILFSSKYLLWVFIGWSGELVGVYYIQESSPNQMKYRENVGKGNSGQASCILC
jgi:hypothetical protein